MTDNQGTRRKRLRYRCWHRGTKELDLLLGRFADAHVAGLAPDQLDRLEALLEVPEPALYDWIVGRAMPEAPFDHDVMTLIRDFNNPTVAR
ncbi:MAG: succinate dehydrogenase assembly factor 2 [Kiloniellales bacterium]|nr:succinate dehydrogenase assembly factor 2 [Kiloniellales bacterium]